MCVYLRRNELLQFPPEGYLSTILAHGSVVDQEEEGVVFVEGGESGPWLCGGVEGDVFFDGHQLIPSFDNAPGGDSDGGHATAFDPGGLFSHQGVTHVLVDSGVCSSFLQPGLLVTKAISFLSLLATGGVLESNKLSHDGTFFSPRFRLKVD